MDSESADHTVKIATKFGVKVITVNRKTFDHGGTRNLAASQAAGDVFVFMTQDALPRDERFLEEILKPLEDSEVAAVSGRQIARNEASPLEKMTREFNYPDQYSRKSMDDLVKLGIKLFFFTNVCSAIRRETFYQIGGFPEPIILNEDMVLAAKCILKGYTTVYNPKASVIHSHNYSLLKQFRRNFDIGVSLRMNEWILQYATAEKEGAKLVTRQLGLLWRQGHKLSIPRWFAEAAAKYSGYRLGLAYRKLPMWLRKKCSMHRGFWSSEFKATRAALNSDPSSSRIAR